MDSLDNVCTAKTRTMLGRSKHVDGFSDTSSAGSILDEADREVSSLTERAFKSLCVAEEGICNDLDMPSSPSAISVNHASELPSSERRKPSTSELKNCNKSSKLIQKQPKELADTFQESTVQCSVEEKDAKGNTGNGFLSETVGSSHKASKQKSKVSSLIEAFDQSDSDFTGDLTLSAKKAMSGHSELSEESDVKNIAQWDTSAIINIHKEKSSFSAACQENYWGNKKQLPQGKGSKTNILGYTKTTQYRKQGHPTDLTILNHCSKMSDKSLSEKASKVKKPDSKSNFLHSECSAFKSWHDHSKTLFEDEDHIEKLNVNLQSSIQMKNLSDDVIRCRRAHSLVQVQFPNEVKTDRAQKPVNCSPSSRDSDFHSFMPEENNYSVKRNQEQSNSLQVVKPEKNSGGAIENQDEEKGFQLWRNSRKPLHKNQMDTDILCGEVLSIRCQPADDLKEVATLSEKLARGESPSFSISKLLTPNIVHNANATDMSTNQPIVVTPPLIQLPVPQGDEIKGGADYQLRDSYKSKASSLLYNLKDVRKRVKSTYSSAVTPQNLSEQSKNKGYIFQNIQQANERTSSAPLRLGIGENHVGDSSEQEKPDKMSNALIATPTAGCLSKAALIHKAEPETWKNDDYLNVRSPQTVKETASYPTWRTKNARSRSAMIAMEIHAERGLDRKVSHQLNKLMKETDSPPTNAQQKSVLARNSPEETKMVQEKTDEKQNRFHRNRKPECHSFSHTHKANCPNENNFRKQDDMLASQRAEDTCPPMMESNVPCNWISSHSAREDKAGQDLKSSNQSYFVLGDNHYQDTERVVVDHSTERNTGSNAKMSSLKSNCPAAEESKDVEKNELQYYALSNSAANSESKDENQNLLMEFQSHLQEKVPSDLTGNRVKDNSPLDMLCEEKFYSMFSKQEVRGPGNNVTNSPRPSLFKIKDNVLKTSPVTKSVKPTIPKIASESAISKETPDMFVSGGNLEGDKLDFEEMPMGKSVAVNPRSESACSIDSKAAGKPPVVPPKSEKALRRAKKLATRRKRADSKQKMQSSDDTETDATISNAPVSPPCVPTSQMPLVCSPAPTLQLDSCVIPAVPNIMALNSAQAVASVHSFPLSQRKLLQDPETGQFFFVDIPIQVQTKTLYDPETGKYFQVSIPSTSQKASLDFFNNSYVLYPGFLSFPLSSVSALRPPSQRSAPAILLEVQEEEESLKEWTNTDLRDTGEQGNQPYIETLFDPHTGSRAGLEDENQCSAISSQLQPEGHNLELIVMGELEDIATENN
ncbi:cardiac-enriched FHL2-interacting protein [Heterodontus francisci]|uniref:cardiac-enriched FHL2-interacting protein n=1 Tax=Heterodontus francisci TaxID=7792 RepID=UPI00355C1590